jgi:hypothetical protein
MSNKLKKTYQEVRPNAIWDFIKWILEQLKEWGWLAVLGYPVTLLWQWLYNIPVTLQALIVLGGFWTMLAIIFGAGRHFWINRLNSDENAESNELSILPEEDEIKRISLLEEKYQKELGEQKEAYQNHIKRLETKLADDKKFYEHQITSIKQNLETEYSKKIELLNENHRKEIALLENQFEKEREEHKAEQIESQPEQKVEILFDKMSTKYLKITDDNGIVTRNLYIGVKNLTDESINGLKVQIERLALPSGWGSGVFAPFEEHNILLREINDNPPYKQSFTLNPRAEMRFYLGEYGGGIFKIYRAEFDAEPFKLPYSSRFTILVEGNNIFPYKRHMTFVWKLGMPAAINGLFGNGLVGE